MRQTLAAVIAVAVCVWPAAAQFKKPGAAVPGNYPLTQKPVDLTAVRRIDRQEAMRLTSKGEAVFIDVRSTETFAKGHIRGAISIPQSKLRISLSKLPQNKMLIPYCACHAEETAAMAVLYFNRNGIANAAALKGGWLEWKAAGLPVEGYEVQ